MKKLLILFLLLGTVCFAQEKTYYKNNGKKVSQSEADYYKVISEDGKSVLGFYMDGKKQSVTNYKSKRRKKRTEHTYYLKNGNVKSHSITEKKKRTFTFYFDTGELKRKEIYNGKKRTFAECYDEKGNKVPFYELEIRPVFPGGKAGLTAYLKSRLTPYVRSNPERIIVFFVVNSKGKTEQVEIKTKGVNSDLSRIIKAIILEMPQWEPGYQDKKAVDINYSLPLRI